MTSAAAGYLQPSVEPIDDEALDDFLHDVMVGISGLPNELVRPRFQEDPPAVPSRETTWVAFGVHERETERGWAWKQVFDGGEVSARHEKLTLIASFYGPQAGLYALRFRDGLQIDQNVSELGRAGMGLVETIGPRKASELVKEKWRQRQDLTIYLNREMLRVYPVLNLLSAHGVLVSDLGTFPFDTDGSADPDDFTGNGIVITDEAGVDLVDEGGARRLVIEAAAYSPPDPAPPIAQQSLLSEDGDELITEIGSALIVPEG